MSTEKARRQVDSKNVRRELLANQSQALLKALHLITRDGKLNADTLRKLKQVNHLVGLLTPGLDEAFEKHGNPVLVDVGSGNAYLGFILYELFFKNREGGEVICIETREDLHERAVARAAQLGFSRMKFIRSAVDVAVVPDKLHVVTALHACDTATDDALALAISHNAEHVAVVPCCQAEVAQQLRELKSKVAVSLGALFDHPWHRREFGSHLTNVIRALVLESRGFSVTVTELTGWEHSLKNELILGRRVERDVREPRATLEALLEQTGVKPKLVRALTRPP